MTTGCATRPPASARQRVDGHRARLAELEADARAAEAELAGLASAPEQYAELLAEKEHRLISDGDPRGGRPTDLATELDRVTAERREHAEAHRAGKAAHDALREVLRHLKSARGASTWDMFGGGFIADTIEYSRLGAAKEAAWHAQRALDVLSRELADVGVCASPRLPTVDTQGFVDMFFDNVITDVIRHQRIENTLAEVEKTAQWVRDTGERLKDRHTELSGERARLLASREELLRD